MHVDLHEVRLADRFELVNLTGFDDEDIAGLAFELDAVDLPQSAAFADELDFVVGMTMRSRARAGLAVEEIHTAADVALISTDELVRAADVREVFLADTMHDAIFRRSRVSALQYVQRSAWSPQEPRRFDSAPISTRSLEAELLPEVKANDCTNQAIDTKTWSRFEAAQFQMQRNRENAAKSLRNLG